MLVNTYGSATAHPDEPAWAEAYRDPCGGETRYQVQIVDALELPMVHLVGLTRRQMEQLGRTVAAALAADDVELPQVAEAG